MKRITFLLMVLAMIAQPSKASSLFNCPYSVAASYGIEDGWYKATVKYDNYSTGTHSTYTLGVKVQYERVVAIDFGNGGSVHSGINNEGYLYSGGSLNTETDYNGNVSSAY